MPRTAPDGICSIGKKDSSRKRGETHNRRNDSIGDFRAMRSAEEDAPGASTLVAVGAVLCVEVLGVDAKHVVALDADAMQRRLLGLAGLGFGLRRFVCHGAILARRGRAMARPRRKDKGKRSEFLCKRSVLTAYANP